MQGYREKRRKMVFSIGAASLLGLPASRLVLGATSEPFSLGSQYTLWGMVDLIGKEERLFDKAGIQLDERIFDSGKSARDAILAGRLDAAVLGATPFVVGASKGGMVSIATVAYAGKTIAVVAGTHTNIKSVANLRGKTIGTQVGSSTHNDFETLIAPKYGLKKGDYKIINIKFADLGAALASKSIDAFAGDEPQPAIAEYKGYGRTLVTYDDFVQVPVMLGASTTTTQKRHDAVVAFLKGWLSSVRFIHDNPQRASQHLWKVFSSQGLDLPQPVILRSMQKMRVDPHYDVGLKAYLTKTANALKADGQIDNVPNWDEVLLTEPLAAATKV
jgi:NitT/TauT family transport system substrate-binding protein